MGDRGIKGLTEVQANVTSQSSFVSPCSHYITEGHRLLSSPFIPCLKLGMMLSFSQSLGIFLAAVPLQTSQGCPGNNIIPQGTGMPLTRSHGLCPFSSVRRS